MLVCYLQFDSGDYKLIEEGKHKVSWWCTVEPLVIGAPSGSSASYALADVASFLGDAGTTSAEATAEVASAEVSISKDPGTKNAAGTNRTTSLQF